MSLPNSLADGTTARGSEVRANDDAIVGEVNGNLTDVNVATGAAIDGRKLSNVAGSRVPTDRIEDDAVDATKLKDSATIDLDRAVTTNHIRDAAVLQGKIKLLTADFAPGAVVPGFFNVSLSTGITAAQGTPISVVPRFAGPPTIDAPMLSYGIWFNTANSTWYIFVGNASDTGISTAGLVVRATFIAAT